MKLLLTGILIGLILGGSVAIANQTKADNVTVGARVPMTEHNCWASYKAYQGCIDKCFE